VRLPKLFGVPIGRSTVNVALIFCALWTEICRAFLALDALRECELQRDWAREETAPGVVEIVLTERLLQE
jgi:hypothetical protein